MIVRRGIVSHEKQQINILGPTMLNFCLLVVRFQAEHKEKTVCKTVTERSSLCQLAFDYHTSFTKSVGQSMKT